jgi:hypothetical protein
MTSLAQYLYKALAFLVHLQALKIYIYKITEADIYAGFVNTSAYAKSSFSNQPITSSKAVTFVRYEHSENPKEQPQEFPQEHPSEHPLEHF